MNSDIVNPALAKAGRDKIAWAARYMQLLGRIKRQFEQEQPLKGLKVSLSIHLEAKTAYLCQVLQAGGAEVAATGCNPLSTQDDVAAALAESGIAVYARHGADPETYQRHLCQALDFGPDLIVDDGGDFVQLLHGRLSHLAGKVRCGCEETTTGIARLKARVAAGQLAFPMIDVNDAMCKHLFDNRYGTGQSVWDGIMRTTNLQISGRTVVVAGYGWCGKGVSMRAKGLGAKVVVCEVDAVKAIEAAMDGFSVMPMAQAAAIGDLFVTVTGCRDVIRREHFERMKDGALLANAGHFDVEIAKDDLEALAAEHCTLKPNIEGYTMPDGRTLCLLAQGRLVNLAAGDGHPVEIMDMSFALQALSVRHAALGRVDPAPALYPVPDEIDQQVARMKLEALGSRIDTLSDAQRAYLSGWEG